VVAVPDAGAPEGNLLVDFWVEIVTLVIPGFNDSNEELREAARFLADLSPDFPWHVTAFHKDYKMTDPDNTSALAASPHYRRIGSSLPVLPGEKQAPYRMRSNC